MLEWPHSPTEVRPPSEPRPLAQSPPAPGPPGATTLDTAPSRRQRVGGQEQPCLHATLPWR